jgi:tetratricopeptide (TPR) repeat protein
MTLSRRAKVLRQGRGALVRFALGASLALAGEPRAFAADRADAANTATAEQRKNQAKSKYQQGVELYRNERYVDAVALFLEADALSPSAALSFNIARAYEKLADDAATLRWYRNYLRLNPAAPNGAEVRQDIQALSLSLAKKGIQQITVLSTPSGATVAIDGQALGVSPLTVELKPGAHHALVTLRGFNDAQRDFTLGAPTPMDLPIDLEPAPATAPPLASTEPTGGRTTAAPEGRGRRFGVAPYITLGAGALALGGALYFEVSRRSAQNAARDDVTQLAKQDDLNAMNSRQTAARVMLGVGGVLVATGATLLVFNTRLGSESTATALVVPGGAALSFSRSF